MRKIYTLLLLCIMGTVGARAQATAFSQDFTTIGESTNPSDYGFVITGTTTENMSATVTGGKLILVSGWYSNSRGYDAKASFTGIGSGNEVTFTCTWETGSATGSNNGDGSAGSFSRLILGDGTNNALDIKYCGQDQYLMVNNVKVKESVARNQTLAVSATLNMNTQRITSLSIGNVYVASDAIDFYSSNVTTISMFTFSHWSRSGSWGNTSSIDDVSITYTEARESVESIVVNYTYNNSIIASENLGVAGLYTGDTYTVPFRMYVQKDGVLYKTSNNASGSYYRDDVTLTTNTVVNKPLTLVDLAGGTIELFEDLDDTDGENASIRASYGLCYNNKTYTSSTTLSPGIYTFIIKALNKGRGSSVSVGNTTVTTIDNINSLKGAWTDKTIAGVEIPNAGNVTLVKGGSNTIDCYDIIIAIRTGNLIEQITIPNNESGLGSYVTTNALDFSEVDGLKAYIAKTVKKEQEKVVITPVTEVPAGTPIFVKGIANQTYYVPVGTCETALTENLLSGSATDGYEVKDGDYIYALYASDGKLHAVDAGVTIPAKKAYLDTSAMGLSAKVVSLSFVEDDDEATAIITTSTDEVQSATKFFNAAGQQVGADYKGLVIDENGKKFVKE